MSFTPNLLSQRDPRWKDEKLGFHETYTIATDGCTLTCLTMLVNGYGLSETPSTMNRRLKDLGSGIGFLGSLIVWPGLARAFPQFLFQRVTICRDRSAPVDEINKSLDAGLPLIVEIEPSPAPDLQYHWVILYARQDDDYLMLDPWPQPPDHSPAALVARYGYGRSPAEFITGVVWYESDEKDLPVMGVAPGADLIVRVHEAETAGVSLRSGPATSADALAFEPIGTRLHCLESDVLAVPKIGVVDQWLKVRDPDGKEGFVAAWYVDQEPAPAPTPPTPAMPARESVSGSGSSPIPPGPLPPAPAETASNPTAVGFPPASSALTALVAQDIGSVGLRMRDQPSSNSNTLAILSAGSELAVLEPADQAVPKIGQVNQWLNVRDEDGNTGYVAAWYLKLIYPPSFDPAPKPLTVLVSSQASAGLRLRDRPSAFGNILEVLLPGTLLTVLETASTARTKIGVVNQWLKVKLPGGMTGYVAAWYVTA